MSLDKTSRQSPADQANLPFMPSTSIYFWSLQADDFAQIADKSETLLRAALTWAQETLISVDSGIQVGAVFTAIAAMFLLTPCIKIPARHFAQRDALKRFLVPIGKVLGPHTRAIILLLAVLFAQYALQLSGRPVVIVRLFVSLTAAWVIIRFISSFIAEPFWAKVIANTAWGLAALNIFGFIGPITTFLGSEITILPKLGDQPWSALLVLKGLFTAILLLWGANWLSKILRKRINTLPSLTPSIQLLLSKAVQMTLFTLAVVLALGSIGFNFTSLAIVGGALSFGIGFGLQRIFANLISGVILLMDRSIKPGDVIEVDDTYGKIGSLGLRYTSVITRDRKEHLIPNESFVTGKVVNWSYSDPVVRVKRSVGIAYQSDVRKAIALALEAMSDIPRVLKIPKPACLLTGFGDNSVDLELRFWIRDADNGVSNISSEVLLNIWDVFNENGIEFPFPQRDVHLLADKPLAVTIDK